MDLVKRRREGGLMGRRNEGGLLRLQDEMNDLFDRFFGWWGSPTTELVGQWWPVLELAEKEDHVIVRAEMPGLKREDIDVSVHGNVLTLSGEKKEEAEPREGACYCSERRYGSFRRDITLPAEVDADKVEATYKDGVLTLTLPKVEEAKTKKIAIKS